MLGPISPKFSRNVQQYAIYLRNTDQAKWSCFVTFFNDIRVGQTNYPSLNLGNGRLLVAACDHIVEIVGSGRVVKQIIKVP